MKKLIICLTILLYGIIHAQEFKDPLNIIISKDIKKYSERRDQLLKKRKWFKYDSSYITINRYTMNINRIKDLTQEKFLNKSFIQELYPAYRCLKNKCKTKDSILLFDSRIYDSIGNPLIYMDELFWVSDVRHAKGDSTFKTTYENFKKYKLLYMFHINGTNGFIEFGVTKNGDILVLNKRNSIGEDYPLEKGVYPFEYFIENYWGKLFPSEPPRPQ